jgi:hypothetical protein
MSTEPRWRVGNSLGRTLYLDDQFVGIVDTPALAHGIVSACNAAEAGAYTLALIRGELERRIGLGRHPAAEAELRSLLDDLPTEMDWTAASIGIAVQCARCPIHCMPRDLSRALAFGDPRSHPAVLRLMAKRLDDHSSRIEALEPPKPDPRVIGLDNKVACSGCGERHDAFDMYTVRRHHYAKRTAGLPPKITSESRLPGIWCASCALTRGEEAQRDALAEGEDREREEASP